MWLVDKLSIPSVLPQCNCKNSRCLKLYCECFASGEYCHDNCNCMTCANNLVQERARAEAMHVILERNPLAFKPKIGTGKKVWVAQVVG